MSDAKAVVYSVRKVLMRLLRTGKSYVLWYVALCVAAVAQSIISVGSTEAFRRISNAATSSNVSLLHSGLTLGLSMMLLGLVIGWLRQYYGDLLDNVSTIRLQSRLVEKLGRVRMPSYETYHTGDLISRISESASTAQSGVNKNSLDILNNVLQIAATLVYLTALNASLTVGSLIICIVLPFLIYPLSKHVRRVYDERQKAQAESNAFVQDAVQAAEVVRSFSLAARLRRTYEQKYERIIAWTRKALFFESLINQTQFVITIGGIIFIMGYGGILVKEGRLDVGGLVAFLFSFERIANPLFGLTRSWPQFQQSISSANRVFELLDLPEERADDNTEPLELVMKRIEAGSGASIVFSDVRFGYDGATDVLQGVSFTADALKVTAIAGPSGSGKSTLFKLLMRYADRSSGAIACNGARVDSVPIEAWRSMIAYVPQEAYLFSGTILENIRYGDCDASEKAIIEAARAANIHDFIMSTQHGYETRIGERGIGLSGGERQRIAIARAVLKNPHILLLDEPTSALDSDSEYAVQLALKRLMKGRTTIVIAHRLSTIRDADRIVFLEDGAIQEEGTHEQLLNGMGKYWAMYEATKVNEELSDGALLIEGVRS